MFFGGALCSGFSHPCRSTPRPMPRAILAGRLRPASLAAWKAIAQSGRGLEFAFLPFRFEGVPLALSSRLSTTGVTIVELAPDTGRHPDRVITAAAHRQALANAHTKGGR